MSAPATERWTHVEQLEARVEMLETELASARAESARLRRELEELGTGPGAADLVASAPPPPPAPTFAQLALEGGRRAKVAASRLRARRR